MLIQVGQYRITSDPNNIILERLTTPRKRQDGTVGEPAWYPDGYYCNLNECVDALIERGIKDSDAQDLRGLLADIAGIRDDLKRAVKGVA